jgi:hypothetical protein
MSERRRKTAMFSIRLNAGELAAIQRRASDRGLTVSAHIRDLALNPPPALQPGQWRFRCSVPHVIAQIGLPL